MLTTDDEERRLARLPSMVTVNDLKSQAQVKAFMALKERLIAIRLQQKKQRRQPLDQQHDVLQELHQKVAILQQHVEDVKVKHEQELRHVKEILLSVERWALHVARESQTVAALNGAFGAKVEALLASVQRLQSENDVTHDAVFDLATVVAAEKEANEAARKATGAASRLPLFMHVVLAAVVCARIVAWFQ